MGVLAHNNFAMMPIVAKFARFSIRSNSKVSQEGLHPTEDKIRAVRNAPIPTTTIQLKSFLGLFLVPPEFSNFAGTAIPTASERCPMTLEARSF